MADNEEKPSLANPVPSFANPFRPQLQRRTVDSKPFSFDSRTTEMLQHREQLLNNVVEEEQKVTIATNNNNTSNVFVLFNLEIFYASPQKGTLQNYWSKIIPHQKPRSLAYTLYLLIWIYGWLCTDKKIIYTVSQKKGPMRHYRL